jgi:hypothetical protein
VIGLPDPTTPADIVTGWICETNGDRRYAAVSVLHRAPCRFCTVDRDALRKWLSDHEFSIATDADRCTLDAVRPRQRRAA